MMTSPRNFWLDNKTIYPVLLILLSLLILLPRLVQPDFGLLDDGRTLSVASQIMQGHWQVDFDREAGRFRPVYWAYNALLYRLAGTNPRGWFLGNLVLLSAAAWLLYRWVSRRSGRPLVGLGAGVLFLFSGPVVESFYTLSKSEPLQVVLILGALNLIYALPAHGLRRWDWRAAAAALLLFLAAGVKETTLVMIPIGLGWAGLAWGLRRTASARTAVRPALTLGVTSLLAGGLFYVLRRHIIPTPLTAGTYTDAYALSASAITASLIRWAGWLLRDDLYLLPLGLWLLYHWRRQRTLVLGPLALDALLWTAGWMAIFLPWVYMVEYYMLPFSVGAAVFGAVGFYEAAQAWRDGRGRSWAALGLGLSLALLLTTLPTHWTNARLQMAVDRANREALAYVASHLPPQATLLINIQDPNEYYEQIGLHLRAQYKRADLNLQVFRPGVICAAPCYVLSPFITNQPRLSVRLGVYEPTQAQWNATLDAFLATPGVTAQTQAVFEQRLRLFNLNWPRALCVAVPRLNYCAQPEPFLDRRVLTYGWRLYAITKVK